MSAPELKEVHLPIEPATAEAIAPFGAILGRPAMETREGSAYYGSAITVTRPVDFACEGQVDLSLATLRRRPGRVQYLERHFQHTQTFIPLGGKPFVIVLAPPTHGDMPDLAQARAFRVDGAQGLALHVGVWHEFPFPIEDGTDIVVVLSSRTTLDLTSKDPTTGEAMGPDLDKKDIAARTGIVLVVDLDSATTS